MKYLFPFFLMLTVMSGYSQCEDFEVEINYFHPTCPGFSDGAVLPEVTGGTPEYDVTITNEDGDELGELPGGSDYILPAGWYYITVVDAMGCTYTDSVELIYPEEMIIEFEVTDPDEDPTVCDAYAVIDTILYTQGDYEATTVLWLPDGPSGVLEFEYNDICSGTYDILVIDSYGCTASGTPFTIEGTASVAQNDASEILFVDHPNTIEIKNMPLGDKKLFIYTLSGEKIKEIELTNQEQTIDKGIFPSGIYVYQLEKEGERLKTGKISF